MSDRRERVVCALALLAAAIATLPIYTHWKPDTALHVAAASWLVRLLPLGTVLACLAHERKLGDGATALVLFLAMLTLGGDYLHEWLVDLDRSHLDFQIGYHHAVLALSPSVLPHSYRFLPNAIVRWLEYFTGDYVSARDVYRHTANFLLTYCIYKYARLHLSRASSLLVVGIYYAIYPITLRYYAGQLTDPLSHLSFMLAFLALERRRFGYFLITIALGSLAKESILALAVFYALFERRERADALRIAVLFAVSALSFLGVRLLVNQGQFGYSKVSGVTLDHLQRNLQDPNWHAQLFFSVGILLPFVVIAWGRTPLRVRQLVVFLLPVLIVTNIFFSWFREVRNLVPVLIPMAVCTAIALTTKRGAGDAIADA